MIRVVLLCSGKPGAPAPPPVVCWNPAEVRLVRNGDRWQRPMCADCAIAFEDHCAAQELPAPFFVWIDDGTEGTRTNQTTGAVA